MRVDELDTPALLLDLDRVERNLDRMAAQFAKHRVKLRPHAKTHKTATVARMQLERGAIGICCAKLEEAQALAAGGIRPILITTEIVGHAKIERLMRLSGEAEITIVVDDSAAARSISDAALVHGRRIATLVDVDVGRHRTGVAPGEPALRLGRAVAALPGLRLCGLQGYEGHLQHIAGVAARAAAVGAAMTLLGDTAAAFAAAGLSTEIVTTGGTGTGLLAAEHAAITDVQPGSYVMMDAQYGAVEGVGFEHALSVLCTVISANAQWAIVDAGFKALSSDAGAPRVLGARANFTFAGDEHGKITFPGAPAIALGTKLQLLPSHCDTTINLHAQYAVHRSGVFLEQWPIVARGCTR